jgi:HK97 family phage major capsid protein
MGATLTKTEPTFEMLEWRLHKLGGYTEVDNELIETSPQSIEALLSGLFGIAIQAKTERNILRGSGVGEPLGILNSPAIVNITPATNSLFSWPDVGAMWSRFKSAGGTPVWLIHPSVWPDILTMELGSNGANAWTLNMQSGQGQNINGFPIITSEHLPQANSAGNVVLADLGAYLLFNTPDLSIAYSEHAAFLNDQGTWRFTQRIDGMPWLRSPITLADPTGSYTVSPFVIHAD